MYLVLQTSVESTSVCKRRNIFAYAFMFLALPNSIYLRRPFIVCIPLVSNAAYIKINSIYAYANLPCVVLIFANDHVE